MHTSNSLINSARECLYIAASYIISDYEGSKDIQNQLTKLQAYRMVIMLARKKELEKMSLRKLMMKSKDMNFIPLGIKENLKQELVHAILFAEFPLLSPSL